MKTKDCIMWLWKASDGIRLWVFLQSLLGVLHVSASLGFVWFSKELVDAAVSGDRQELGVLTACMLFCMLTQVVIGSLKSWAGARADVLLKNSLRHRMFRMLMQSRWDGKEAYHTGDSLNRVMDDVRVVSDTVVKSVPSTITAVVQFAAAFIFLFVMAPGLAWLIPAFLLVMMFVSRIYVNRMRRLTRSIRSAEGNVQSLMQESLQNRVVIHTMEKTPYVSETLSGYQDELQEYVMDKTNYSVLTSSFVKVGFAGGYAAAFLWGVYGIYDGAVTFGMMTAFLQLVSQVQRPLTNMSRQLMSFINSMTSAERLSELVDIPKEDTGESVALSSPSGVRFENVSYSYPDADTPVLNDFSYDFRPGTITSLQGETGAGKTTVMRLMLALLKPQKGSVTIYDSEKSVEASPLTRCNIVYVPQGNTLMSGTVRENLLLGNSAATEDMISEALHLAAADFVMQLPQGLETVCGERGAGLSEGQAQRIAIARALLREGGLILLDEPTAALDVETEKVLLERLSANLSGRTVIIVTHRPAALEVCQENVFF